MIKEKFAAIATVLLGLFTGMAVFAENAAEKSLPDKIRDVAIPATDRIRALSEYSRPAEGRKNPMEIVEFAEQYFLSDPKISQNDRESLICRLLLPHATHTLKRQDLVEKYHRLILAYREADYRTGSMQFTI